jgi:proline iminopeptidase
MDHMEQRMIDVNGATLEIFLSGTGDPVVCESHPFNARSADSPSNWEHTCMPGRVVGVNPRGVGSSSEGREPRDFTFRQHVDDLEAVRLHLGVERWVFCGGSGGASIGLLYALA